MNTDTHMEDLEGWREELLDQMLLEAGFDGWTRDVLDRAARNTGLSEEAIARGDVLVAFPRGVEDVLAYWSAREDAAMVERFTALDPAPARIRDKITALVRERIAGLDEHREAARRAAATLALPIHAGVARRLTWETADAIWRALDDKSTDFNYYTKRTTLSAVYLTTLTRWFSDEGQGVEDPYEETWAFLDKRIDNVMQFEKVKAQVQKFTPDGEGLFSVLGRLRYPR